MGDISNGTRILLTEYLLKRLTDENHALSREELISKISGLGTTISSNTIKADIESIKAFNDIISDCQDTLLAPYKANINCSVGYTTKQKKGAFVEKTYYSDIELIILTRLLQKCLSLDKDGNSKLIEKVLSDTSLHKINQYHLLDNLNGENKQINTLSYLEKIINAINNFACISFKRLDYVVNDNVLKESVAGKAIMMYPTNIDIIDNQIYVIGYHINNGEDLELEYYRINRITELRVVRTPKYVQKRIAPFKDQVWLSNDPLNVSKDVSINLQIRVYAVNSNKVFELLHDRFKDSVFIVNQFHQFVDISIENVVYDDSLVNWFLQLANYIEVFKPLELRDKIKDEIRQMNMMYRS
ncbi:MAG: WYL domain-containing protein [Thomasclavelia sp.]|uniref:WYL domain-containing protein n=1 Tax=Thomasclavelia sp. TaxID=3025757 RepID=UPI0039A37159